VTLQVAFIITVTITVVPAKAGIQECCNVVQSAPSPGVEGWGEGAGYQWKSAPSPLSSPPGKEIICTDMQAVKI